MALPSLVTGMRVLVTVDGSPITGDWNGGFGHG